MYCRGQNVSHLYNWTRTNSSTSISSVYVSHFCNTGKRHIDALHGACYSLHVSALSAPLIGLYTEKNVRAHFLSLETTTFVHIFPLGAVLLTMFIPDIGFVNFAYVVN